jgi:hypothetical protein
VYCCVRDEGGWVREWRDCRVRMRYQPLLPSAKNASITPKRLISSGTLYSVVQTQSMSKLQLKG